MRKDFAQWLREQCQAKHLTLRKAEAMIGVSHTTINIIMQGKRPSVETVRKLAQAFGGDGIYERIALEDYLLLLAGYRTQRPPGEESSLAYARLMDKVRNFGEPKLEMMSQFAEFLIELEEEVKGER